MQKQGLKPAGSLCFSQYDQTIQAAVDGQGIALGRSPLVRRLIKQRRLIAPLARRFDSTGAYYLIVAALTAQRPEVKEFVEWMLAQARLERENRGH